MKPIGFLNPLEKEDLLIGSKMPEIGIYREIDIGELLFQFGLVKMEKNLSVLALLLNWKNFLRLTSSFLNSPQTIFCHCENLLRLDLSLKFPGGFHLLSLKVDNVDEALY